MPRCWLDDLGLSQRFFTILGGDLLGKGRAKPAPDLLLEMQRLGGGGRCVYVGDTTFDSGAAKAAEFLCVAVSFGYNDVPVAELETAAVIDHFDELVPVLEGL
ncbi:MAG: HAD hydrolase-like protein [Sphingomonadaceae bacterium]